MSSLAEEYPKQQARCRELLKAYQIIPEGFIGVTMIEAVLKKADIASASGDIVAMVVSFKEMKDCK